jgi:hypothetical protein
MYRRDVPAPGQLLTALHEHFGIELPAGTRLRRPATQ